MKIKSVELRDHASHVSGKMMTMTLLPELHDFELMENGWLKWRLKGGEWFASPPEMVRNVCIDEEVKTVEVPYLVSKRKPKSG